MFASLVVAAAVCVTLAGMHLLPRQQAKMSQEPPLEPLNIDGPQRDEQLQSQQRIRELLVDAPEFEWLKK
jgi:hypothetical protein